MYNFTGLAIVLGSIFGLLYVLGPIIIWLVQKQSANPQLTNYSAWINQPAFGALAVFCNAMHAAGFEFVGVFGLIGQTTNINTYFAYMIHRRNGDAAIAASIHSTSSGASMKMVLEFATRFSDQSSITTSNSGTPSVFVRPRNKPVYKFPAIHDPLRLYRLHQQLILRDKPGMPKDVPAPGTEAARLVESMQKELSDQLPTGIMKLDSANACYRPTLLGAFRMTWKMLPPFKQISEASTSSQAAKLTRSLEAPGGLYAGQGL